MARAASLVLLVAVGLGVFAVPSVGWLVGFPVAAWVIGWLTEKGGAPYRLGWGLVADVIGGIVVLYALGIQGTAWGAHLSVQAATLSTGWYELGDATKAVIAALVARGVHAAYPGLLPEGSPRSRARRGQSTPARPTRGGHTW